MCIYVCYKPTVYTQNMYKNKHTCRIQIIIHIRIQQLQALMSSPCVKFRFLQYKLNQEMDVADICKYSLTNLSTVGFGL